MEQAIQPAEYFPAMHPSHEMELVDPVTVDALPVAKAVQLVSPDTAPKLLAGHATQDDAPVTWRHDSWGRVPYLVLGNVI